VRTTIELPDELFRQVKARAVLDGMKLKDLITCYIEQGLRNGPPLNNSPLCRRSELPIARPATGKMIPAMTNAELAQIELDEDFERHERSLYRQRLEE